MPGLLRLTNARIIVFSDKHNPGWYIVQLFCEHLHSDIKIKPQSSWHVSLGVVGCNWVKWANFTLVNSAEYGTSWEQFLGDCEAYVRADMWNAKAQYGKLVLEDTLRTSREDQTWTKLWRKATWSSDAWLARHPHFSYTI